MDFNSYGARRGNHEVMMRGTFANIRLRNLLLPGTEGGVTCTCRAASRCRSTTPRCSYKQEGTPLVILAGKEYGTGSSRDWAAKGTMLLGVQGRDRRELRAHPPLEPDRHGRAAAAVPGRRERADARAHRQGNVRHRRPAGAARREAVTVTATPRRRQKPISFEARVRIDTPKEREYFSHGGILQYVLRQLAGAGRAA